MISRKSLSRAQAEHAMRHREFDSSVTAAAPSVAVVLTQDWCGQWAAMDRDLAELAASGEHEDLELVIFHLAYNREDYFQRFLDLKERVWGNRLIPYVRYYRHGKLAGESNFASRREFLRHLQD